MTAASELPDLAICAHSGPCDCAELDLLEPIIKAALDEYARAERTYVEAGRALTRVKEGKLYRSRGFKSFELYCKELFGISKTHANRLVQAADVAANLAPIGAAPTNEAQARELAKVPAEAQAEVWHEALETAEGSVTAAHVAEVVKKHKARTPESTALRNEVAKLYSEGLKCAEIARRLDVCPSAVHGHLDAVGARTAQTRAWTLTERAVAILHSTAAGLESLPDFSAPDDQRKAAIKRLDHAKSEITEFQKRLAEGDI